MNMSLNAGLGGALLLLTGCGSNTPVPTPTGTPIAEGGAANLVGKTVSGVGEVTAIDAAGGKITLKHQAIPAAHWPAMTMAFAASPSIIADAKVGEQVSFDLKLGTAGGEIKALRPR